MKLLSKQKLCNYSIFQSCNFFFRKYENVLLIYRSYDANFTGQFDKSILTIYVFVCIYCIANSAITSKDSDIWKYKDFSLRNCKTTTESMNTIKERGNCARPS